jgi:hypothetical protein
MDPSLPLPMILPKGIVVNTKDVYKEVASFPVLPNDKIRGYWHGNCPFLGKTLPADLMLSQSIPSPIRSSGIPRPAVWRISGGTCGAATAVNSVVASWPGCMRTFLLGLPLFPSRAPRTDGKDQMLPKRFSSQCLRITWTASPRHVQTLASRPPTPSPATVA